MFKLLFSVQNQFKHIQLTDLQTDGQIDKNTEMDIEIQIVRKRQKQRQANGQRTDGLRITSTAWIQ